MAETAPRPVSHPTQPTLACPHRPACPGCPLIELPYAEQLARKRQTVLEALRPYAYLAEATVTAPHPAPSTTSYRVRAKLVADAHGLGLFAAGSHTVVDTPSCRVLRSAVDRAVQKLRSLSLHRAGVTSVDVREVDGGVLVTLAAEDRDSPALAALVSEVQTSIPDIVSLAISARGRSAPQVLGSTPVVIAGAAAARHTPDPDAPYHYAGPGAFTQAHPGQLVQMHRHVESALVQHLGSLEGRRVLELYAGTGAFGLRLARAGAHVTLVESFAPSMGLAGRAASEQRLVVETHVEDAGIAIERFGEQGASFDAILVNPPRRGVAPQVRRGMARLAPKVAVYVSCNPRTLARDAADLARLGLAPASFHPYDMIPLSDAVETLAVFLPSQPVAPLVIHADDSLIVVDKPGHEPVTPNDGAPGSLLDRVRHRLDAPEAVALHPMGAGVSGVCLFARTAGAASELSRSVAERSSTWIVLAKGITHPKGTLRVGRKGRDQGPETRYTRVRVVGGHAWLSVHTHGNDGRELPRALARIGHPVVGDGKQGDTRTNQHFAHRHDLDRPFLHIDSVHLSRNGVALDLRASIAPDLDAVRESLEGRDVGQE